MAPDPTTSNRLPPGTKVRYRYLERRSEVSGYAWIREAVFLDGELLYRLDNEVTVRAADVRAVAGGVE
jgi:hypothetical protein